MFKPVINICKLFAKCIVNKKKKEKNGFNDSLCYIKSVFLNLKKNPNSFSMIVYIYIL